MPLRLDSARSVVQNNGMMAGEKKTELLPAARELDLEDWRAAMAEIGLSSFRASQVWHGLQASLVRSWDELTTLPAALRSKLAERFDVDTLTACEVTETPTACANG